MGQGDKIDKSHQTIEKNLKKVYHETLNEDIPERFVSLLERLRNGDRKTEDETSPDTAPAQKETR